METGSLSCDCGAGCKPGSLRTQHRFSGNVEMPQASAEVRRASRLRKPIRMHQLHSKPIRAALHRALMVAAHT